ncbi:MAG: L,D-transpeptidase family protein [Chloroflexota bacterium]
MDIQGTRRSSKARERQQQRRQRRENIVQPSQRTENSVRSGWLNRAQLLWQDAMWYVRTQQWVWRVTVVAVVLAFVMTFLSYPMSGRIYPQVSSMGVAIGGMSTEEAEATLREAWADDIRINVMADGDLVESVPPQALGLTLDAAATAAAARQDVNWRDGMISATVKPVITLTDSGYLTVQDYLLNMTETINEAPFNAGFQWQGDALIGVPGRAGRLLDIAPTLAEIQDDPAAIVELGRFTVYVSPVPPDVSDPTPYVAAAREFTSQPFDMIGYDPFEDKEVRWSTSREVLTSWLEASITGLTLREETYIEFMELQNQSLNPDEETRFLNPEETLRTMREAIESNSNQVQLRIRYFPQSYTVEAGDTASKIARKTGIPFYLIEQHNPGRDLNVLSVGDTLNMPTRDVTMPNTPVAEKRIVVNLEEQELWAYENDQLVFNWTISSGRSNAPTSPGIYQILNHDEVAYGSSFSLCDEGSCGQWEMYWFMGMYEVVPGLMNGFHGAVLLPNGAFLNGGDVGYPSTFGCVMSRDDAAQELFEWAEVGTVVEIISDEFEPQSDLAAQTLQSA